MKIAQSQIGVIIVDDERKACNNLKNILKEYVGDDIDILGVAYNTAEAEARIRELNPDAIFLDIQMPKENAFQFLERLAPVDFEVVFVTAYDEFAIKAFRLNAVDYILKPIDIDEIIHSVQKLRERLNFKQVIKHNAQSLNELSNLVNNKNRPGKITLRSVNHSEVVDFKNIYFVEAQASYSRILFKYNGEVKEMIMSYPLSDYEDMLPVDMFCRIHKSYLVNCIHVNRIINGENNYVVVNNEYTLPVSRRRFLPLKKFLKAHTNYNE